MEKHIDLESATPVTVDSAQQLRDVLNANGIKTQRWEEPPYKSVDHLYQEIEAGESRIIHLGTTLGRLVSVVNVDVRASIGRRQYQLIEDRQQFNRGGEISSRRRGLRCVSEKIKGQETPEQAARRGIKEELSVDYTGRLDEGEVSVEQKPTSFSYPGLLSIYTTHRFTAHFGYTEWNPDGYVERQLDKSTFFTWQELPS